MTGIKTVAATAARSMPSAIGYSIRANTNVLIYKAASKRAAVKAKIRVVFFMRYQILSVERLAFFFIIHEKSVKYKKIMKKKIFSVLMVAKMSGLA